ncbi:MAG: energy transducer TonB [Pyrinomonadaceae bacterium]|nr:energy transducer TonB [Pyrinomonadaceae bacterium]
MNWKAFFLTLFVLTLAVAAISAQDDPDDDDSDDEVTYSKPQCLAPAAEKFDEVSFSDKARLDRVIADYQERLYSMPGEAKGYIIVYGGQQTSFTELADITSYVKGHVGLPDRKVGFINGGYRHFATVEFAIEPLECTESYGASPTLGPEDLQFKEFPVADTLKLSKDAVRLQAEKEIFGQCPPAARAMRVCSQPNEVEVFVAVDSTGTVRFVQGFGGHPLLRQAATLTAKSWKFRQLSLGGKPKNFVGVIVVRFPADESENIYD